MDIGGAYYIALNTCSITFRYNFSKSRFPEQIDKSYHLITVKPVHTGMPWGQTFIPVWTGSRLEGVFAFREEQTTVTCTIDMRVIIQDVSSLGLQMIGACMQIN